MKFSQKEVKLAMIYNRENSKVNSNLRVFPIFRTVNLSFLLFKVALKRGVHKTRICRQRVMMIKSKISH